ncbi:UNVERIFIED_CONTAM: hypothetical protein RMT77_014621 [Armadillidium vulgare]
MSLFSMVSQSTNTSEEYPELLPVSQSNHPLSVHESLLFIDVSDDKSLERNLKDETESLKYDGKQISFDDELIDDAEQLLEDLREVTVDAKNLIKKEVLEGIESLVKPEEIQEYSWVDGLWGCVSALTFVSDFASDVFLSSTMNSDPNVKYWSWGTFMITIVSVVIQNLFSAYWYYFDDKITESKRAARKPVRPVVWLVRVIFHILLLAPVLRQLDVIYYGIKSTKEKTYKDGRKVKIYSQKECVQRGQNKISFQGTDFKSLWLHAEGDSSGIDLIGTVLQDIPQVILQFYILTKTIPSYMAIDDSFKMSFTMMAQLCNIFISLVSMAWSISGFVRTVRLSSSTELRPLSIAEVLLLTLSHLTAITPQVICFALLATENLFIFFLFICCHWAFATLTISMKLLWLPVTSVRKSVFAHDRKGGSFSWIDDVAFSSFFGITFLVTFVDVDGAAPVLQTVLFALLRIAEEIAFLIIWMLWSEMKEIWKMSLFVILPSSTFLSLLFSLIFYKLIEKKLHKRFVEFKKKDLV